MRTVFRLVTGAALLGALAVGATSAASAPLPQVPALSVAVMVNPTTVARGGAVTASVTVTNHTETSAVAQVTFELAPPTTTMTFGPITLHKTFTVPRFGQTLWTPHVKVPLGAPVGIYTLTVTAPGADAPAPITLNVT